MNRNDKELEARPVRESHSEMAEVIMPNDANPLGNLMGGRLMQWIDIAGALAAHRHSRRYVVTASMDHLDFLAPVHVGDLLILRSWSFCTFAPSRWGAGSAPVRAQTSPPANVAG
jgi:acyl-CoA hydrolase